ncbi:sensor histidine kinase [Nonomuraea fuscirosea]|uniref:sensor histidine kinase n=1 Tax=Nonomuraea fuscirosea TaxID=1291556 RepID=UPI00371040FD
MPDLFHALRHRLRSIPPSALDVALTLAVLAGQTVPFLYADRMSGPQPWTLAEYWPVPLSSLPLLVRRRLPMTVFVVVAAASLAYSLAGPDVPYQPVPYGWLAGLYTVAELCPGPQRALAVLISLPPAVAVSPDTFVRSALTAAAAYAMGRSVVRHRRSAALEAELATERERARIARDMHDILAHGISVMTVQAEAGPYAVRVAPERAEQAFKVIADAGRDAQGQLSRVLGEPGGRSPVARPALDGLPRLVERVSATGPAVRLTVTGTPAALHPDTEAAAYRIVQEALTNIVKHARATAGEVRFDWKDGEVVIMISDNGRGPAREAGPASGRGLNGMRERATACGGTLTLGAGRAGFEVKVRLPIGKRT